MHNSSDISAQESTPKPSFLAWLFPRVVLAASFAGVGVLLLPLFFLLALFIGCELDASACNGW
jgi:hypothetical protein